MANLEQTLQIACEHLNDHGQTFWAKELLIPFHSEAHRELQLELHLNGIPVIKKKSAVVVVPPVNISTWTGEINMPNQPADIIEPLECWERQTGSTLGIDWDLMIQKSWVPETQPVTDLVYWNWVGEQIKFVGAVQSNDVKLYYNAGISIPTKDNDPIGFIYGELYTAPRCAALAARSIGGKQAYAELTQIAKERIDKILTMNVHAEQGMPFRRRPYRHGRMPFIIR